MSIQEIKFKDVEIKNEDTIKRKWEILDGKRKVILDRARECAALTIPSLLPPEGSTQNTKLPTPYQGIGARGVNNLASKLLLTLLPPNTPFFKFVIDEITLAKLSAEKGFKEEIDKAFGALERTIMSEVETKALRVPSFEALKHLIVTGNVLEFLPDEGGMKVFRLDQYVVRRDPLGNVLEIITKEQIHPIALPENIRNEVLTDKKITDEPIDLFTYIKRTSKNWEVIQEINGIKIPGSEYPLDELPWLALRWTAVANEDYGRSHVEEYLGDLKTLEALTKALVEISVIAAKILILVRPNGTTSAKKVQDAPNGAIIEGSPDDVKAFQLEKYYDLKVVSETIAKIEQRLSQAFLLMSSLTRDAERVTAEEIRAVAKELEDSLGGVYSVLSQEKQLPLVKRLIRQLQKQKKIDLSKLKDIAKPVITTGFEALGRGNDLTKLNLFLQNAAPLGPEALAMWLNVSDYLNRIAIALGIPRQEDLINSPEMVQMMQQQAAVSQVIQSSAPGAIDEFAKGMVNNVSNSQKG